MEGPFPYQDFLSLYPEHLCEFLQVFRDTDLVLPHKGASGRERLSFRLEYIACSVELATTLQVRFKLRV